MILKQFKSNEYGVENVVIFNPHDSEYDEFLQQIDFMKNLSEKNYTHYKRFKEVIDKTAAPYGYFNVNDDIPSDSKCVTIRNDMCYDILYLLVIYMKYAPFAKKAADSAYEIVELQRGIIKRLNRKDKLHMKIIEELLKLHPENKDMVDKSNNKLIDELKNEAATSSNSES